MNILLQVPFFICVVIIIQGGGVAAPIASQVLGEVLPYLEIESHEEKIQETVEMPNVTGITLKEAEEILKELNIGINIQGELSDESIITEQIPAKGIQINEGANVILSGQ